MNQKRLFIYSSWVTNFLRIILFLCLSQSVVEAGALPDTDQTKCYNNSVEIACPATGQPFYGQDDPEPDSINAPWTLTGIGGFSRSGTGNQTLHNMTPDNYTLTWGDVTGWAKPKPIISTQNLTAGEKIAFAGTYKKTGGLFWFHLLLAD